MPIRCQTPNIVRAIAAMSTLDAGPANATSVRAYRPRRRLGVIGIIPQAIPATSSRTSDIHPM
jgi:hypothetical protein